MEENIRVTFFNKVQKGKLLGTFGIYLIKVDMYLTDLKLLATDQGGFFVAPPCRTYLCEKTGKEQFQNFWWFGTDTNKRFQRACHDAINAYFEQHPDQDPRKVHLDENPQQQEFENGF